jgi:outer membrane protein assembly factor BamB
MLLRVFPRRIVGPAAVLLWLWLALSGGALPAQPAGAGASGDQPAMRFWTDATGKFRIRASLEAFEDDQVTLRREDGEVVTVPLERLSAMDRRFLERARRTGEPAPPPTRQPGAEPAAGEWPSFRGPNRDGKSPDTGLLKSWPEGGPRLLWKQTGIGEGYSSVAVADGTVYITGDKQGKLVLATFDLEGNPKWQADCGPAWTRSHPGSRATPTIDGDRVYLYSGVGILSCLDAKTGRLLWSRDAKEFGGSPGGWGYAESVLIHGNLAIFKPGGQNCIVAVDKTTGRNVWTSRGFSAGPEYSSCLVFVHDGMTMLTTGTREGIVCVNPTSGALLWANDFSAGNTANCPTPAYADGYVFWANGYGKGGICLKLGPGGTATEAWRTGDMVCHHGGYVIHEGHIYGNNGNGWACLELKTGEVKWRERAVGKGSLCWADGMLYLFSETRGQAALATCSPDGLEITGRVQVEGEGPSWAHPVVVGGRLYLRYDTNLYCFDVKGGG